MNHRTFIEFMYECCRMSLLPPRYLFYAKVIVFAQIPTDVYCQTNQETQHDNEKTTTELPVEIGPGGDIKKEPPRRTRAEAASKIHFHALWESRYITEGRDNLSRDSLFSLSTDLTFGNFTFAPWIAVSSDTDYHEINLNAIYGIKPTESVELYFHYTHLQFDVDGEASDDNEIGLEFNYSAFKNMAITASWIYSFDADGSYFEVMFGKQTRLNKKLVLITHVGSGINNGYISDGHEGIDHIRLRLGIAYQPWQQTEFFAYVSHSEAINRDAAAYPGDANLEDVTWYGLGATQRF